MWYNVIFELEDAIMSHTRTPDNIHRLVVEISDEDFTVITKKIDDCVVDAGFTLPANYQHITIHELFKDFIYRMVDEHTICNFVHDGGLDEVFHYHTPNNT